MAVRLSIILLFLLPVIAQAQLKSEFIGICTFDDFSNTTGDNYRGDILNFIDRYNLGVTTKNIQVGDEIIDGSGDVFEVLTVHSTASNFEADVTVQARVSASGAPTGSGQVYRPTVNGIVPPGSVDNLGLSNVTKGLIDMHNALRLDSLLGTVANGDSIIAIGFANDSLSITMESDTVYTAIIPVDSLHQLQADSIAALYDSLGVKVDTIIAGNNISVTYAEGAYTISAPNPDVGTDDQTAGEVWYNDSYLPLNVNDVQQAIDSLKRDLDAVSSGASDGVATAGALDVGNEEIDMTVAAPGSAFSIDLSGIEGMSSFSGWDTDASDDFSGAYLDLDFAGTTGLSDGIDNVDDADASVTNEGSLSVAAGTGSTAVINSNTSGSAGVTIEAQAGIGITENTGIGTIFIENTGDLSATNELDIIGFTGDVGSAQQIGDGEFLDLEGGFGVATVMSTDKVEIKADTSQLATVWALGDSLSNIASGTGWLKDSLESGDVRINSGTYELEINAAAAPVDSAVFSLIGKDGEKVFFGNVDVVGLDPMGLFINDIVSLDGSNIANVGNSGRIAVGNSSNEINILGDTIRFLITFQAVDSLNEVDYIYGEKNGILQKVFTSNLLTTAALDTIGGGGSAFWEDASGTVRTVSASSGLDFVFGSTQLDGSESSANDERFFFDNSKGYFFAGSATDTVADDANRGFYSASFGLDNMASGYTSSVTGGERNIASGNDSHIGGGQNNTVTNLGGVVTGGRFNTNESLYGSIGGGTLNEIPNTSAEYATIPGGYKAKAELYGALTHASGAFDTDSVGQAQNMQVTVRGEGTGTSDFDLFLDGGARRVTVPNNAFWSLTGTCITVVVDIGTSINLEEGDSNADLLIGKAQNYEGTVTTDVGVVGGTGTYDDPDGDMLQSGVLITADDTNNALKVTCTPPSALYGGTATTVTRAACTLMITQLKY